MCIRKAMMPFKFPCFTKFVFVKQISSRGVSSVLFSPGISSDGKDTNGELLHTAHHEERCGCAKVFLPFFGLFSSVPHLWWDCKLHMS